MTAEREAVIRPLGRPGDLGWVAMRHGELYAAELGFGTDFEAFVARVAADYDADDSGPKAAWMAEVDGVPAGSIFCVRADDRTARLRLLIVDPAARGLGLGSRLVTEALHFARDAGYEAMTLWTLDKLGPARRIYARLGFELTARTPHEDYGSGLMDETWQRRL
ncbi:GNAT family N-acetyltransferase [Yinghuangia sp. ASG 101]|uniref:GNAT family N-acetyltransferase n=1 Tax=Yinghuangia sp. ASG 101 TaxID=2896848 RepID=UPI001E488378|nr:GNAT family N-acetyltransferase [Yinghuangia sp. ASG 101]UGQ11520.1 GNAT family N-acetyltransferase [Yinghuangia sp. ASG 101]